MLVLDFNAHQIKKKVSLSDFSRVVFVWLAGWFSDTHGCQYFFFTFYINILIQWPKILPSTIFEFCKMFSSKRLEKWPWIHFLPWCSSKFPWNYLTQDFHSSVTRFRFSNQLDLHKVLICSFSVFLENICSPVCDQDKKKLIQVQCLKSVFLWMAFNWFELQSNVYILVNFCYNPLLSPEKQFHQWRWGPQRSNFSEKFSFFHYSSTISFCF